MRLWWLASLVWLATWAPGELVWGGEAVRAAATLHSLPPRGGWTEIQLVITAGDSPWQGVIGVADGSAKVQVRLSVDARGQRVVALPFWVAPGGKAPRLWVDGVEAGRIENPPLGDRAARILIGDMGGLGVSRATWGGTAAGSSRASLTVWPETRRAYDAYDLAILPAGLDRTLRPAQEAALSAWIRWGGALGLVDPAYGASSRVHGVGEGIGIVAGSPGEVHKAFEGWVRDRGGASSVSTRLVQAWERSRPWTEKTTWSAEQPGGPIGVVLAVYLMLLTAVSLLLVLRPRLRAAGMRIVLVVVFVGLLATWAVAYVGTSAGITVRDVVLLRAHAEGGGTHAVAWVHARADRFGMSRFEAVLNQAEIVEAEPSAERALPHRAIQWDLDRGSWVRSWAVGETAAIRVDGIGPDIQTHTALTDNGREWEIDNRGPHAVRAAGVLLPDGGFRSVPDIPPGSRCRVETSPPATGRDAPDFWRALLPVADRSGRGLPVLVGTLDPPIPSVRFLDGNVKTLAQTYVVVMLPPAGS